LPFNPDLFQYDKHPRRSIDENLIGIAREFDTTRKSILDLQKSVSGLASSSSSNSRHSLLSERDLADQHPMSAITGLESALEAEALVREAADVAEAHSRSLADIALGTRIDAIATTGNWDGGQANSVYGGTTLIDGGNA
jgi:hypothetical protein